MQHRRSIPDTFEDQIAAEKARSASRQGPAKPPEGRPTQKDQAARDRISYERVAYIARPAAAEVKLPCRT
jgi:hypothetical protein